MGELAGVVTGDGEAGGLFEGFSLEEHFVGEVAEFFGCSFAEIELHERPAGGFVAVFGGKLLGREGRCVGEGFDVEQVQIVYSVFGNLPGLERWACVELEGRLRFNGWSVLAKWGAVKGGVFGGFGTVAPGMGSYLSAMVVHHLVGEVLRGLSTW